MPKSENNKSTVSNSLNFNEWIRILKRGIRQSQIKAVIKVNAELLKLY